ncbi:MAG: hypothetical protein J6T10_02340, partial [Methanobrevibacter sp.]|nr:hypothetical protein [Methanobrevibacter sp.]
AFSSSLTIYLKLQNDRLKNCLSIYASTLDHPPASAAHAISTNQLTGFRCLPKFLPRALKNAHTQ